MKDRVFPPPEVVHARFLAARAKFESGKKGSPLPKFARVALQNALAKARLLKERKP